MSPHHPAPFRTDDSPPTVRNFVGSGSSPPSTRTPSPLTAATGRPLVPAYPEVGGEFLGFRLVRELGRGAFGRVYLATQGELAGRPVALKVSVDLAGESRSLAQLQHTNIVPVYSVHHDRGLHAVCMPYFGGTTLADLLRRRRGRDTPPTSGAELVDTLRGLAASRHAGPAPTPTPDLPAADVRTPPPRREQTAADPPRTDAVFGLLDGLTFSQAVSWVMGRVADGLAHAHDRGIVHRDVKPANVLVADDGQPMLLDFGVAADLKARATADATGGTIPYMAPEQLEELYADAPPADPRSDVYAVGVILYEWLTGLHPFSPPAADLKSDLPRLIDERRRWVPRVRVAVPGVPADLEAIVRTCVAADPNKRYQSAAELSEDLRRHLAHEPLRVAPEPAGWGRVVKWRRRHPKLGGQLFVAGGVVLGLGLCGAALLAWQGATEAQAAYTKQAEENARQQDHLNAARQLAEVQAELRVARYMLTARVNELRTAPEDLSRMTAALARYGLPDDPEWHLRPAVAALPPDPRHELLVALSDACLMVARAHLQAEDGGREAAVAAERFNALSEAVRPDPPPRAVFQQRADILTRLDRPADARTALVAANNTPLLTAEDHFLSADELFGEGKHADAAGGFREAVRLDPTHFWAQFQLGVCQHRLGRHAEARACYSAAVALRPDFPWAYYNRAMATVPLRNPAEVTSDLDSFLKLEPTFLPARLHRAHALAHQNKTADALADLNAVLAADDPGGMHVRAYLQRAKLKRLSGDTAGAAADTAAALPLTPADELGWLMRGLAQVENDPTAALADIEKAARLNPNSVPALQNQVHVLEKLKRYADAAEVLERLVPLSPNNMVLLASRGLIAARLGKWEQAVADAAAALAKDRSPQVRLPALATYALASKDQPEWKAEAFKLLGELVKEGYKVDWATDPDLAPLRDAPEFKRIVGR